MRLQSAAVKAAESKAQAAAARHARAAAVAQAAARLAVVDLDAQNIRGDSALHIAAKRGKAEAFEFLVTSQAIDRCL